MDGMNKWHVGESFIVYSPSGEPCERITILEVIHNYFSKKTHYRVRRDWSSADCVEERIMRETDLKELYDYGNPNKKTS